MLVWVVVDVDVEVVAEVDVERVLVGEVVVGTAVVDDAVEVVVWCHGGRVELDVFVVLVAGVVVDRVVALVAVVVVRRVVGEVLVVGFADAVLRLGGALVRAAVARVVALWGCDVGGLVAFGGAAEFVVTTMAGPAGPTSV